MTFNDENEMVIGPYYPDPPNPPIDRELQYAIERETRHVAPVEPAVVALMENHAKYDAVCPACLKIVLAGPTVTTGGKRYHLYCLSWRS